MLFGAWLLNVQMILTLPEAIGARANFQLACKSRSDSFLRPSTVTAAA